MKSRTRGNPRKVVMLRVSIETPRPALISPVRTPTILTRQAAQRLNKHRKDDPYKQADKQDDDQTELATGD